MELQRELETFVPRALPEDAQRTYLQKAGRLSLKATKQGVDPARAARVQSAVHVRSASMAPWFAESARACSYF